MKHTTKQQAKTPMVSIMFSSDTYNANGGNYMGSKRISKLFGRRAVKVIITFILLITLCPLAFAQPAPASISQQLHSFSPMAQIYLKHLGLADKNSNGVIDKDAGEGYEAFAAKYGNADVGFYANNIYIFGFFHKVK
jgi:hypothetical protein